MITVGLDVATCTGMAMVGVEQDRGKTIAVPKERGFLRVQLIAKQVADTLQVWQPDFVAVEGYAYVRNVGSFVTLVEIGTMVRLTLRNMAIPWVEVPPSVLKKWTTESGNASKEEMASAAFTRWGFESPSHDIIDALALAHMAQLGTDGVLAVKGVTVGWMPRNFSA